MPASAVAPAWTFFRQWLKNPRSMASVSPSSRKLAQKMVAEVPPLARRVVELGAGTGVFTRALIDRGIAPGNLLVVELNHALHSMLKRVFPETHVVHGDACNLAEIVTSSGFCRPGEIDAVISGLGFLTMSRSMQRGILESTFKVLAPGRPLIQFTYAPTNPLPRNLLSELGLSVHRTGIAWMNVPPATVYVYTRNRSTAIHAMRAGRSA